MLFRSPRPLCVALANKFTEKSCGLRETVYFLSFESNNRPGRSPEIAVTSKSRVVSATSIRLLVRFEINARCGNTAGPRFVPGLLFPQAKKLAKPHNIREKMNFCFKLGAPELLVEYTLRCSRKDYSNLRPRKDCPALSFGPKSPSVDES